MKTSILFLLPLLILGGCGENLSREYKGEDGLRPSFIVGGEEVKTTAEGGNPFGAVVLLVREDGSVCSGTLNTPTEISTAAHCFWDIMDFPNKQDQLLFIKENIQQIVHEQHPGKRVESIPPWKLRPYMAKAIKAYIKQAALDTAIYFGNDPTSTTEFDFIYGLIRDVKVQEGWIDVFMDRYVSPSSSLESPHKPYGFSHYKKIENDRITLVLETPAFIEGIRPIPWMKKDELKNLPNKISVFAVGFGKKLKPWTYADLKNNLGENYLNILIDLHKREDTPQETRRFVKILIDNKAFSYQHKKVVSLEIQDIFGNMITVRGKNKKQEGACYGDSGGPFLVRLENGEFRQIAVTSMIAQCGGHTAGSGVDLHEMKKLLHN